MNTPKTRESSVDNIKMWIAKIEDVIREHLAAVPEAPHLTGTIIDTVIDPDTVAYRQILSVVSGEVSHALYFLDILAGSVEWADTRIAEVRSTNESLLAENNRLKAENARLTAENAHNDNFGGVAEAALRPTLQDTLSAIVHGKPDKTGHPLRGTAIGHRREGELCRKDGRTEELARAWEIEADWYDDEAARLEAGAATSSWEYRIDTPEVRAEITHLKSIVELRLAEREARGERSWVKTLFDETSLEKLGALIEQIAARNVEKSQRVQDKDES
ncbi:hypothetical protein [Rhodococcus opacus]|uniref:Uncharacterized protein n=1 Tax=Rhodococcus opacus TaxID=37919 RepID=A0A2S8JB01_RHOOP|nr:hypothetical protein [Rhodococcus opacus]PQP24143.1 hypothetical protein C5613_14785 [Rhodococcus opacus]